MNIEKLAPWPCLETCKKLVKAGIILDTYFVYGYLQNGEWGEYHPVPKSQKNDRPDLIPPAPLAEEIELPEEIVTENPRDRLEIDIDRKSGEWRIMICDIAEFRDKSLSEAKALMLIWLAEQNLIPKGGI